MKGRGGSSTFVRRFSSVSLPRPVVLIVLIYITPFKLCCPSGLKSNQGSWGRNECLGFEPGSRTEASFGCSQSGRLCCLQHKRRVRQTLFACDTLFWCFWYFFFMFGFSAYLVTFVCIRIRWWCCINLAYSRPKEKLLQRLTFLLWLTLLCGLVHYFTLKHDKLCRLRSRRKRQMWLPHSQ